PELLYESLDIPAMLPILAGCILAFICTIPSIVAVAKDKTSSSILLVSIVFVAAWVLILRFSSVKLAGFGLDILGICLGILGVDLFFRRDKFSKADE
ncbi:hypothetical protein KTC82_27315, partial [Klebsiella pneumoniae]|nr:hypothetical protein [Klebsiella pneumoniae]